MVDIDFHLDFYTLYMANWLIYGYTWLIFDVVLHVGMKMQVSFIDNLIATI